MESSILPIEGTTLLTDDVVKAIHSIPGLNGKVAQTVLTITRYSTQLATELGVSTRYDTSEEKQRIIALVLLVRLIELVESILVLAAVGARQELTTLFRVFLDAYFLLANTCSDPAFVQTYMRTDAPERLKFLNAAAKYDDQLFAALNEYATKEVKAALAEKIKEDSMQAFNSYLLAEKAGCAHIYDSMYRICSAAVHTTPRCLNEYLRTDDQGDILAVVRGGNAGTIDHVIYDIGSFFIKGLRGVCELFVQSQEELVRLDQTLERAANGETAP